LWAFLILEDQREAMDIGCNWLLTVAHNWHHISRIKNR
jgi:hypothetical protein